MSETRREIPLDPRVYKTTPDAEVCDWRTGNTRCKEYRDRIKELEKLNKNLERQFVEDTAKIQELENLLTGRGPSQVS